MPSRWKQDESATCISRLVNKQIQPLDQNTQSENVILGSTDQIQLLIFHPHLNCIENVILGSTDQIQLLIFHPHLNCIELVSTHSQLINMEVCD